MKDTEHCSPVVLFITLYKGFLNLQFVDEILKLNTIQLKAIEQYFSVVSLFITLFKLVPTFESAQNCTAKCDMYSQNEICYFNFF